jgi:hypothetical protein
MIGGIHLIAQPAWHVRGEADSAWERRSCLLSRARTIRPAANTPVWSTKIKMSIVSHLSSIQEQAQVSS